MPNGDELYFDQNGDHSIAYTNGTNVFFEAVDGAFDYYNYQPSGAQYYQASNGDWWTYNLKSGNWAYFDSAAKTTFGAQGTVVYALESDGSVLQYDSNLAVDAF